MFKIGSTSHMFLALNLFANQAFGADIQCPNGSTSSLNEFRESVVGLLEGNSHDAARNTIESCYDSNSVPKCVDRSYKLSLSTDTAPNSLSGGSLNDEPRRRPPREMQIEEGDFSKWKFPSDIESIAAENNWVDAKYKSRRAGGFDSDTSSLYMVYIPGDSMDPPVSYDRWLNFALPRDTVANQNLPVPQEPIPTDEDYVTQNSKMPRTFTMVTLEKANDEKPSEVYFQMFRRTSGKNEWKPTSSTSCGQSCHPNGLREISPLGFHVDDPAMFQNDPNHEAWFKTVSLPESEWKDVQRINDAMSIASGYQKVSWRGAEVDGVYKPFNRSEFRWPIYGAYERENPYTRTKEYILGGERMVDGVLTSFDGCFKSRKVISHTDIFGRAPGKKNTYELSEEAQSTIDWEKVSEGMNCAGCHDNNMRAAFTKSTSPRILDFKILTEKSMPVGSNYNPMAGSLHDHYTLDERIAIANCLIDEFKVENSYLKQYLTKQSCNGD